MFHKSPSLVSELALTKTTNLLCPAKTQSAPSKRAKKEKRFFAYLASWHENRVPWECSMTCKAASHEIKTLVDDCIGRKLDRSELKMPARIRSGMPGTHQWLD